MHATIVCTKTNNQFINGKSNEIVTKKRRKYERKMRRKYDSWINVNVNDDALETTRKQITILVGLTRLISNERTSELNPCTATAHSVRLSIAIIDIVSSKRKFFLSLKSIQLVCSSSMRVCVYGKNNGIIRMFTMPTTNRVINKNLLRRIRIQITN